VTEFVIGLASWVLQDGNYSNFTTGETRRFALEMGSIENLQSAQSVGSFRIDGPDNDGRYDVVGQIVHEGTVVDFGEVRATTPYQMDHIKRPRVGAWLEGRICLGVDPFFYFEEMVRQDGMVPAIYAWRIDKIELNVSPMELVPRDDPRAFDRVKVGPTQWRLIDKTRMFKDEDDHVFGGYRLHCTLLPDPPVFPYPRFNQ
jgi:hypothetical protein